MKIPKYVDKALQKRAKAAITFIAEDAKIVQWLKKNNVDVSNDHILTGACSLCEPYSSIETIRQAILEK